MMETHNKHIYDKKRYKGPNHYFPRFYNRHPIEPDSWDDLDTQSPKPWDDNAFQRKPNWLDIKIYQLVNDCYKHFGKDKPGDILPEDSFLIYFADMMHHDNAFDDGWDLQ